MTLELLIGGTAGTGTTKPTPASFRHKGAVGDSGSSTSATARRKPLSKTAKKGRLEAQGDICLMHELSRAASASLTEL